MFEISISETAIGENPAAYERALWRLQRDYPQIEVRTNWNLMRMTREIMCRDVNNKASMESCESEFRHILNEEFSGICKSTPAPQKSMIPKPMPRVMREIVKAYADGDCDMHEVDAIYDAVQQGNNLDSFNDRDELVDIANRLTKKRFNDASSMVVAEETDRTLEKIKTKNRLKEMFDNRMPILYGTFGIGQRDLDSRWEKMMADTEPDPF